MPARLGLAVSLPILLLCGCRTAPEPVPAPPPPEAVAARPVGENWRAVIRADDADRIARLDAAWAEALRDARAGGASGRIEAAGVLLEPRAGQPRAALPPGSYRCRVIRLGSRPRGPAFEAFPYYFCYVGVEGELLSFTKQTGAERPGGFLWSDSDQQMVFLGAMATGDEAAPPAYGERSERDVAGVAERIGPFHYRILFPWTRAGATLDVLEMVPVPPPSDDA